MGKRVIRNALVLKHKASLDSVHSSVGRVSHGGIGSFRRKRDPSNERRKGLWNGRRDSEKRVTSKARRRGKEMGSGGKVELGTGI